MKHFVSRSCLLAAFATFAAPAFADAPGNRCARYGADFVAVSGSDGCVRLGGHVRVKLPQNGAPMGYAPGDGFRNAADSVHAGARPASLGLMELFAR